MSESTEERVADDRPSAPAPRPLRVLLVEDSHEHAKLAAIWIEEEGHARFEVTWVERLSAAQDALAGSTFDAILLDLSLPDSDRLETFRAIRERAPLAPVGLMTGIGDERLARQAVQEGAQDYLVKGDTDGRLLVRALDYAIERRRADEAERHLLETQRIESLTVLAGGVAHQLNNLLVVILGNATLAASELSKDHPTRQYLVEIERASERAARLAQADAGVFGPRRLRRQPVDLGEAIKATCEAMERELPQGVTLLLDPPADPLIIRADQSQIAQLVLNVVTNAVEATVSRPSRVSVRLEHATADPSDFSRAYLSPSLAAGRVRAPSGGRSGQRDHTGCPGADVRTVLHHATDRSRSQRASRGPTGCWTTARSGPGSPTRSSGFRVVPTTSRSTVPTRRRCSPAPRRTTAASHRVLTDLNPVVGAGTDLFAGTLVQGGSVVWTARPDPELWARRAGPEQATREVRATSLS